MNELLAANVMVHISRAYIELYDFALQCPGEHSECERVSKILRDTAVLLWTQDSPKPFLNSQKPSTALPLPKKKRKSKVR